MLLYNVHAVAEMLGKFAHEVTQNLTLEELDRWIAYDKLKNEFINKRRKKAARGKGTR